MESPQTTFLERFSTLLEKKFGGNVLAFVRKCEEADPENAPSAGAVRRYLKGSEPGRDKLVVMARAFNVSVEWLATGKELAPVDPLVQKAGRMSRGNAQKPALILELPDGRPWMEAFFVWNVVEPIRRSIDPDSLSFEAGFDIPES